MKSLQIIRRTILFFAAVLALLPVRLSAEEGMWPFDMVPRERWKKNFGVELSDAWLQHLQLSCVRFNSGGSGSFVSADGLVLTNHHIASDILQKISDEKHDFMKTGFLAQKLADEVKAPDLELNMLVGIDDVTARVEAAVQPGMNADMAFDARRAEIAVIEKEASGKTGLRCDVLEFYKGAVCRLYKYKKFTDVRLVFAPDLEAATFGGDPDNFMYPRYCLDMALVRVYENDKPLKPEHYLHFAAEGAKEGQITFVAGHPGSTSRLNTVDHLKFLRDESLPFSIAEMEHSLRMLGVFSKQGGEQARQAQEQILGIENSLKDIRGGLEGLKNAQIIEMKLDAQKRLREKLKDDPATLDAYDKAVEKIAAARNSCRSWFKELQLIGEGGGFNSTLCGTAWTLVRMADEDAKPNSARLPEYQEARRESLELDLFSPAPLYEDFEIASLADSFEFMRKELGEDHVGVKKILAGKTPQARAAELIKQTTLKDAAARKALAAAGKKGITDSTDPLIVLFREIDGDARQLTKRYEKEVVSVERQGYAQIARTLFKTYGSEQYPDATFTLRLCIGAVKGYEENGKKLVPFTTMQGLFDRAAKFEDKSPFTAPKTWVAVKEKLKLETPFNFVSTNDIVGGNSGSPVVNQKGELIGLIFDGNIQSLLGDYIFDESVNRAIAVDARSMLEALRKIYAAGALADELTK